MQIVSASLSFIPLVGEVKHKSDWTTNFLTEPVAVKGILFGINTVLQGSVWWPLLFTPELLIDKNRYMTTFIEVWNRRPLLMLLSFGQKISRLSGIYRNANMLKHAFLFSAPLISLSRVWGTSACDFARLFPLPIPLAFSLAFSLACFACYKFGLFGFVFF